MPPKRETEIFWKNIWEKETTHNNQANWLGKLKKEHSTKITPRENIIITEQDLKNKIEHDK